LRGLAILLVLGAHSPFMPAPGELGHAVCMQWQRAGWMGVDLFFALSGFLITGLFLRERQTTGRVDPKAFLLRRFFKIYPPALLYVLAFGLWLFFTQSGNRAARVLSVAEILWPVLIHGQNYLPIPAAEHLWSLAVEEHFYVLMLVAFLSQARISNENLPRRLMITLTVLVLASWCARLAHVIYVYSGTGPIGLAFTHNRIDALAAGTLAACLVHCHRQRLQSLRSVTLLLPVVAILTVAPSFLWDITSHRVFFLLAVLPVQAIGLACLVVWVWLAAQSTATATPPSRVLAFVGRSSYSTYLWHLPFAPAIVRGLQRLGIASTLPEKSLVLFLVYCGVALTLGAVGYFAVECPALWIRKKWCDGQRASETPAARLKAAA
ncbi:MAG TPA: acyltransferase, partial [Gemmataceae bacterium]|nr:acyltransferase [Gemmataceae bacterium]